MLFRCILCAVDFSPSSHEALKVATELARQGGRALRICHVLERERLVSEVDGLPDAREIIAELSAASERELERWRREAEAVVPGVEALDLGGRAAWDAIVSEAEYSKVDLIVIGAGARRHGLLGSVAERIVRHAPCAVLVVSGGARPFRRILCAVDFSRPARAAMRVAVDLAAESGAALTLVHALFAPELRGARGAGAAVHAARALAEEALREWAAEAGPLPGAAAVTCLVDGVPATAILEQARAGEHDLIVTGTHGRTGIARALLGSVAEGTVRHADRSVLVVRERKD